MYFQFHNSDWSNIKNVDEQEGWMTFWTSKDNVWSVQRSYLNQVRLDNVFILLLRHVCYVLLWSLSTSNCNNKRWTFEFLTFSHSDHRCLRQIRNKYFLQAPWILEQPINVQNDQSWSSFPTLLKEQSVPRSHKFCGHPFWGGRLPAAPEIPRRDFSDALTPICLVVQIWKLSAWKSDYHPVWNGSKLPFKSFASQGGSKNNYKKLLSFDVLCY